MSLLTKPAQTRHLELVATRLRLASRLLRVYAYQYVKDVSVQTGLTWGVFVGNSHCMSYTIDKGKRLRLPEFRPGDEWIPDWKGENRVELIRQVPAEKQSESSTVPEERPLNRAERLRFMKSWSKLGPIEIQPR